MKLLLQPVLLGLSLLFSIYSHAQYGNIELFAGTGVQGNNGDGGLAIDATLSSPGGLAIDNDGNIYFSQISSSVIRKIDVNGTITTVAGISGNYGETGDNGSATAAELDFPQGLAIDNNGNLYIADRENHKIRKVDTNGIITTFAGNGTEGYSGDGGQATLASLNNPQYVAVDNNGNVYISDWLNNRIRKVDVTGIITTYVGTGTSGFSGDGGLAVDAEISSSSGMAVDSSGNLYFSDRGNDRIRKIDTNGIITTIAGSGGFNAFSGDGGLAVDAELYDPNGIALDAEGNLYIADRSNQRIRKVTMDDGLINTIVGTGSTGFSGGGYNGDGSPGTDTLLKNPSSIIINTSGDVIIADGGNHRIRLLPITTGSLSITNVDENLTVIYQDIEQNKLYITSKNHISSIDIFNISGKKVISKSINDSETVLDVNSVNTGIYIALVKNNDSYNTIKFIKK